MKIEYIPLDDVISLVKNTLSSYFENNLIDETIFYPNINYISKRFGLKIRNIKYDVIEIRNYKGLLPNDFYKLKKAVGCFQRRQVIPEADYRQPIKIDQVISTYKVNHCETSICTNECDEVVRLVQSRLDETIFEWSEFKPLQLGRYTKNLVDTTCPNITIEAENEISFKDNEIITNFDNGDIYIEYYTSIKDDFGNILIPDNEILIKAYRTQMIKDAFEYLIYNTTENVGERFKLAYAEADQAFKFAMSYLKTPEYNTVKKLGDYQKAKFNKYYNI